MVAGGEIRMRLLLRDVIVMRQLTASAGYVFPSSHFSLSPHNTYNNDPDVFNIFRSKELAKILRRTLLM